MAKAESTRSSPIMKYKVSSCGWYVSGKLDWDDYITGLVFHRVKPSKGAERQDGDRY